MKITEAIEKAIEGGWGGNDIGGGTWSGCKVYTPEEWAEKYLGYILINPIFWQCLGKAMGWEERYANFTCPDNGYGCGMNTLHGWRREWHSLIDHLASGGSVEEWFGKLK